MDNTPPAQNIVGSAQGQVALSSVPNCTTLLSTNGVAGKYAVWAPTQDAYIQVCAPPISTALALATGYLVKTGQPPAVVVVPPNYVIAGVSSSSGVLAYQKVI